MKSAPFLSRRSSSPWISPTIWKARKTSTKVRKILNTHRLRVSCCTSCQKSISAPNRKRWDPIPSSSSTRCKKWKCPTPRSKTSRTWVQIWIPGLIVFIQDLNRSRKRSKIRWHLLSNSDKACQNKPQSSRSFRTRGSLTTLLKTPSSMPLTSSLRTSTMKWLRMVSISQNNKYTKVRTGRFKTEAAWPSTRREPTSRCRMPAQPTTRASKVSILTRTLRKSKSLSAYVSSESWTGKLFYRENFIARA